jgi:hypothetical protein
MRFIIGAEAAGEFGQMPYGEVADAAVSGDVGCGLPAA